MTATLDARSLRRRFLALISLRWLPVGVLMPIFVLVPLSRGLSLTEIGVIFASQGLVVLALELPTGGLSDALGRKPILLIASAVAIVSMALFTVADSAALFIAAMVLQGVYRALDSGPLEAWFVDATLVADPDAKIEHSLGRSSAAASIAIAIGSLLCGGLVALHPIAGVDPLLLPLLVALALHVARPITIAAWMVEEPRPRNAAAIAASIRSVPAIIGQGLGLLRSSRVLLAIILVEASWGVAMVTFESLFPIRLSELVGGTDSAAAIMGPVGSAAWFASAAGAAGIAMVSRRIGVARSAALLRLVQGATIIAMGVVAGVIGVVSAYLACYTAHGASDPMHTTLLHRQVDGAHRTTVLSMNSMVGQPAAAIGGIVLAALADGTSVAAAMVVGGLICAAAAPLYLPAFRQERAPRITGIERAAAALTT
ncbi:MAG: MFS transporter [Chloroflexota bacterium]